MEWGYLPFYLLWEQGLLEQVSVHTLLFSCLPCYSTHSFDSYEYTSGDYFLVSGRKKKMGKEKKIHILSIRSTVLSKTSHWFSGDPRISSSYAEWVETEWRTATSVRDRAPVPTGAQSLWLQQLPGIHAVKATPGDPIPWFKDTALWLQKLTCHLQSRPGILPD